MVFIRKCFVYFLSLLLLASLIGLSFAVSGNAVLAHPNKVEKLLSEGNFYHSVVANELHNAQQSSSEDQGAGRVSLSDPAVEQAVNSVFTPALLQQYANTFLNSNYAWLEGKTNTPQFTIDLRPAKQKLAQQIGQQVEKRMTSLPVCSGAQLAQLQATLTSDPLTISCRLPDVTPQTAAKQVTDQINGSDSFLNNPTITPTTLNPNGDNSGRPYYQRLSAAPALYKWGQRLPIIFGALIILSWLGIIFCSPKKRRGIKRIGIVTIIAGVLMLATKLVSDTAFNHVQRRIFTNSDSTIGQLQQSLTDVLHRLEAQIMKINLWFGVAFLLLGVVILGLGWWLTRPKSNKPDFPNTAGDDSTFLDGPDTPPQGEKPPIPTLKQPPRPPRPPRLIQ